MLHCKFSGDYKNERIFKIDQYITKLYVEHLAHPVNSTLQIEHKHQYDNLDKK